MKVGIIGVGIVGGATAKAFEGKHELYLYDKFKKPYNTVKRLKDLAKNADNIFICVNAPMKSSGEIDYSAINDSLKNLDHEISKIKFRRKNILIIIRSTAVSGTTDRLAKEYPQYKFAFNPEFLKQRDAMEDMLATKRVVIGSNDRQIGLRIEKLYKVSFPDAKYVQLDIRTAEMVKYAANSILACQIMIANEIYNICKAIGVNYNEVKETVVLDDRIGTNIAVPGPDGDLGFGNLCFPKDLNALIYLARENQYRPYILEECWRLNCQVRKNKDWLKLTKRRSDTNVTT